MNRRQEDKERLKALARHFAKYIKPDIKNKKMLPELFRAFVEVGSRFEPFKKIDLI